MHFVCRRLLDCNKVIFQVNADGTVQVCVLLVAEQTLLDKREASLNPPGNTLNTHLIEREQKPSSQQTQGYPTYPTLPCPVPCCKLA